MGDEWDRISSFASVCRGVGSFGYGVGWAAKVEAFLETVPLPRLLQLLEGESTSASFEGVDLLSDVLHHVLAAKPAQAELLNKELVPTLVKGMAHGLAKIRALASRQVRHIGVSSFPEESRKSIAQSLAGALHDKETGIGSDASEALVAFAESSSEGKNLVTSALKEDQEHNVQLPPEQADPSVAELRILYVTARIAAKDEESFKVCEQKGLVKPLIDLVRGDDVLMQMNALKLLPLIAASGAGLNSLLDSDIVDQLSRMAGLDESGSENADPFLGDEALRVMSQLSARTLAEGNQTLSANLSRTFIKSMAKRLKGSPRIPQSVSFPTLEMLGAFAGAQPPHSVQLIVEEHSDDVLQPWCTLAAVGGTETSSSAGLSSIATAMRGGALLEQGNPALEHQSADDVAFSALLESSMAKPTEEERTAAALFNRDLFVLFATKVNERTRLRKRFSGLLAPADAVAVLVDLTRIPADEQRCGVYAVLRMVAAQNHEWGLQAIFSGGDEAEKLLIDRSLDMSKQAKEWRFSVLEAVFASPYKDKAIGQSRLEVIKAFLKRGPYLGPEGGAPQVALGDSAS